MSDKISAWINVILISAVILIFTVADFFQEDRLFSDTENRMLAQKPKFSLESLFRGTYTQDYETYVTDQFVSRDKWIAVKTGLDVLMQKKEIGGVYLGRDDYLIEQHLPQAHSQEQVEEKLKLLSKLVDQWDAKVMLVPTADNVLTEKLPAYAPYFDQTAFLEQAEGRLGREHLIDVHSALNEHRSEEIYYRTDHHWTSLGAYYGYQAWAAAMGVESYPYENRKVVTRTFWGRCTPRSTFPGRATASFSLKRPRSGR